MYPVSISREMCYSILLLDIEEKQCTIEKNSHALGLVCDNIRKEKDKNDCSNQPI